MHRAFGILILSAMLFWGTAGHAAAADETAESAAWLLKKATLVHRDGTHNILLRALRRMGDADLEPLLRELTRKGHPALRIHGILGLGEIDKNHRIDLALVAEVRDPAAQAQLISSAVEGDLMDRGRSQQMFAWPGLDPAVEVILATRLVGEDALEDPSILDEALASENPAVRGTAAMLRLHLGDAAAIKYLDELDASDHPNRDAVRQMLLRTALRDGFDAMGPWAMDLAGEAGAERGLRFLALRGALVFGVPQAADAWARRYGSTASPADRIRLALLALDAAEAVGPERFEPLIASDSDLIRRIGLAGRVLARGETAEAEILELLETRHPLACRWILGYARDLPIERARPILTGIILAAESAPNPPRSRGQRIEDAVLATQWLIERSPDAEPILRDLLARVPMLTMEAVVMGMIRSRAEVPYRWIEGIETWPSGTAESLALLLKARQPGVELDEGETRHLSRIVRGGAGLQDPLRIQAAWIYLKRTDQHETTLADVLGE